MHHIPVVSLRLVRKSTVEYRLKQITDSADVFSLVRALVEDRDREHMWVVCLDIKNRVACLQEVSIGSLNAAIVHPREVFKTALLANAAAVVFVHNHPSGDPTPSGEDNMVTHRLQEAGKILGVRLVDHIIIGHGKYYSYADDGGLS